MTSTQLDLLALTEPVQAPSSPSGEQRVRILLALHDEGSRGLYPNTRSDTMVAHEECPGAASTAPGVASIGGADVTDRTCSVEGCDRRHLARGWCGKHYQAWSKYGDPLVNKNPVDLTAEERFWQKVDKTETCWLWTGTITRKGYGLFGAAPGHTASVHRWAYEHLVGPIPEGLQLDHLCRVRNCVRPDHLEPVTNVENFRRGLGFGPAAAARLARTHCKNGHEYTPENTYRNPAGSRQCRICRREQKRRFDAERRGRS